MKYLLYFCLILFSFIFLPNLNASTYVPTDNLFTSTQSDNLLRMANSQIPNFTNLNYIIFKIEDNYYLVASDNYILNTNSITLTDTTIISAIRGTSSYYGYYSYNRTNEDTTIINLDYIVISNIETNKSVTSELFNDFKFEHNVVILITFILGLIFAIFLLRDRRY